MHIIKKLQEVKNASQTLSGISIEKRNKIILDIAEKLLQNSEKIISENKKDLEKMEDNHSMIDRLLLDYSRIEAMANGCKKLEKIKDPLEKYSLEKKIITENGIKIKKQAIALGVVSCIYEARPNVTIDLFNMCIKSGNAVILRGGSQAENSNNILIKIIKEVLRENKIDENIVYNFSLERKNIEILYNATNFVDVIIPRGSKKLIDSVRKKSLIPVIETGAGVVHLYLDNDIKQENLEKVKNIIINAKISRPSVCNAMDTLIINKNLDKDFIKLLFEELKKLGVGIFTEEEKNGLFLK
ncbi:MAG: glutamate-5-semialdehyde dehydrogenase, partial [Candidatus Gracilibacteria bacterium]|nr:glutamate-5-semialdehyde dehydrogenase [Candidatus Gracilibacteria bacterium]